MGGKKQIEKQIEKQAIRRIVQRNFKKKRMENMVLILSILLVTVLMTVMFGAGISLFHNLELANLRMKGTEANVIIPHMEEEEMERFGRIEEISSIGRQQFVAAAVMQEGMSDSQVFAMTAYDKTEWETHIVPTLSDIQGTYPQAENEIMMSRWMLGQLEIDEPKIGMKIPVSFVDLTGEEKEQTFILSGYYVDYINYAPNITPNSANTISANLYYTEQGSTKKAIGNMAVSQAFADRYGTAEGLYGTAKIDDSLSTEEAFALIAEVTDRQDIIVTGLSKTLAQSFALAVIPVLSVVLIMIAGYLLIFNVINISVLREMHMFGQLKTLGATSKQLSSIVKRQSNLVSVIGIPAGLLAGTVLAEAVVPGLLRRMTEGNGFGTTFETGIIISPWIYVFAAAFAYLTAALSNQKPSKMAAQVSPIEALKYVEQTETIKTHRGGSGGKLYRMAYRNVFRSKKKARVTFASLFFGFLIFLIVEVCTYGADYEEKYDREQPDSFTLQNLTFQMADAGGIENILNESVTDTICGFEGVEKITADYVEPVYFQNEELFLEPFIKLQAQYTGLSEEQIRGHLRARSIGLPLEKFEDFSYESTFSEAEIQTYLEDGTGVFFDEYTEADIRQICGKKITLSGRREGGKTAEFTVLGVIGDKGNKYVNTPHYYGEVRDDDVPLYMTAEALERVSGEMLVQTLRIQTDKSRDEEILGALSETQ